LSYPSLSCHVFQSHTQATAFTIVLCILIVTALLTCRIRTADYIHSPYFRRRPYICSAPNRLRGCVWDDGS